MFEFWTLMDLSEKYTEVFDHEVSSGCARAVIKSCTLK